ncbi:adenylosuccinate synthase [Tyzzerella sp. An114]|uniref:adenylosuccinate synthase n=1 Tax=Tyzzerella sp. An114 TaxID=1965545 RepID=UPI000B448924|nr:adenylosuccinate synthase [Tyzzerella sp. An114]OUQ60433.1 adenylosuccinate synthase [Tyzzerella sp. An114]HIT72023.1 adenylosuccinate synthase [Candidatus Fimicola cottocaccae]
MLTSIVGINWGDEGKGRMVDLLSQDYDIVSRYQGGNNAGHTVVNDLGKFILNLLPSGILREEVVNVMGPGMVIDLEHLSGEIKRLTDAGVKISPKNLKISNKAIVCMPYHRQQDILEEDRLGDAKYGSTRRGISPVYGDKYMKKCIRMGDLLHRETYKKELERILEWKNLTITKVYGAEEVKFEDMLSWLDKYSAEFKDYICDTSIYLNNAVKEGKKVMFEAQLGALRDIDYGIYPYTSSSSTIAAYAPIGAGVPNLKLTNSIGIMKAYSTCVGEGPFTAEMFGEEAEKLREAGGEYGAATGRPRRVGPFDVPASRYGVLVQGCDELALTKLDVLSYLEEIPVCVAYDVEGELTKDFPYSTELDKAKPVVEYVKGWNCDISKCRKPEDLPKEALDYIKYIEKAVDSKIKYVSVGAARDEYIVMY